MYGNVYQQQLFPPKENAGYWSSPKSFVRLDFPKDLGWQIPSGK